MNATKKPKQFVYLILLIIPFVFLFLNPSIFKSIKSVFFTSQSLPIKIITWPINEAKKLIFYHHTHSQYVKLKQQNDILRSRLIGLEEVMRENSRFEKLFDLKRKLVFSTAAALVIGRDPSNWNSSLIVNKGENDGIEIGMPVINNLGVVGKVSEVMQNKSRVILLTDPSFSIAALVQRARESGLLSGTLRNLCRVKYLPEHSRIKVGDNVITSKLSQTFPEGLLFGEVVSVFENKNTRTKECLVKPAIELSQIEEVLIVK